MHLLWTGDSLSADGVILQVVPDPFIRRYSRGIVKKSMKFLNCEDDFGTVGHFHFLRIDDADDGRIKKIF